MPDHILSFTTLVDQREHVSRMLRVLCTKHVILDSLPVDHNGMCRLFASCTVTTSQIVLDNGSVQISTNQNMEFHYVEVISMKYARVNVTGQRTDKNRSVEGFHRLVCWVMHGPPPGGNFGGYEAAHRCGYRRCVCPMHMQWMTPKSNCKSREWHKDKPEEERKKGMHMFEGPYDMM
jgi:hypothetical protein